MGYDVRDSKVTGNASRKDILHMQNVGASLVTLDLVNIYMMQLRYTAVCMFMRDSNSSVQTNCGDG
jgi:hypothetical protein